MNTKKYTFKDILEFKKKFGFSLKENTINRLFTYMEKNNKVIESSKCYDSQSGWYGYDLYIDSFNLSVNGYCLRDSVVDEFLNKNEN